MRSVPYAPLRAPRGTASSFRPKHLSLAISGLLAAPFALSAPQGGVVSSGTASISQSGAATTINQSSQKASINWRSFSVGGGETVTFNQPGVSSITLNRVVGNERSVIDGALNANGQVFLLNSNGVLFGKGSQVNVGALVASSLDLSDEDFLSGRYAFNNNESAGQVLNLGTLRAADGGYVALLGPGVANQGVIVATRGVVALGGGNRVALNFNGDSLLSVTVEQGALDALVDNGGAVYADGGKVILAARAADDLLGAQVNSSGIVQARTLDELKGQIDIHAYGGTANVSGTLDASAPDGGDGGFVETSGDKVHIADGTRVTTQAAQGVTGTWLIDPDGYTVSNSGGDMSATLLSSLLASDAANIVIESTQGSGSDGDFNVNDAVSWSSNARLTLTAAQDVNINAAITASGDSAGLTLNAGNDINLNAPVRLSGTNAAAVLNYGQDYSIRTKASYSGTVLDADGLPVARQDTSGGIYGSLTLPGSNATLSMNGNAYTLIHSISQFDALDSHDAVSDTGTALTVSGLYALAEDLDASGTTYQSSLITKMGGATLAGLGHAIDHLTIDRTTWSSSDSTGLIGSVISATTIRDLGLTNAQVSSVSLYVGTLVGGVGGSTASRFYNLYASGSVTGASYVGGLIGAFSNLRGRVSTLSQAAADVTVTGSAPVSGYPAYLGGLVGRVYRSVAIDSVQATGSVTSTASTCASSPCGNIGGLIGGIEVESARYVNPASSVTNSYASGVVSGPAYNVGGLIGVLTSNAYSGNSQVTNSFASGDVFADSGLLGLVPGGGVGGLIGAATYADLQNVYATGDIAEVSTVVGSGSFGGLSGSLSHGTLDQAFATGDVLENVYGSGVGGLVGNVDAYSSVSNAHAIGEVVGGAGVGGLIGFNYGQVSDSWASGDVTGYSGVGGLVGSNNAGGSIARSWASGNVTAYIPDGVSVRDAGGNVGGLAGSSLGVISDSSASGSVTGVDNVGGLVGYLRNVANLPAGSSGMVSNSMATGKVTGSGSNVGGMVGVAVGTPTISNSYWNMGSTEQAQAVGGLYDPILNLTGSPTLSGVQGLTAEQFKDVQYYLNGTIDQVLAARAAQAAAEAAAQQAAAQAAAEAAAQQAAAQAAAEAAAQQAAAQAAAEAAAQQAAAQAAFADAAARQGAQQLARAQLPAAHPDDSRLVLHRPEALDSHIVVADPSRFVTNVQSIEVDGVVYELEDEQGGNSTSQP